MRSFIAILLECSTDGTRILLPSGLTSVGQKPSLECLGLKTARTSVHGGAFQHENCDTRLLSGCRSDHFSSLEVTASEISRALDLYHHHLILTAGRLTLPSATCRRSSSATLRQPAHQNLLGLLASLFQEQEWPTACPAAIASVSPSSSTGWGWFVRGAYAGRDGMHID